jgi:hypothetical protein
MPLALARRAPSDVQLRSAQPAPRLKETALDRILKLIPTEIVALYAALIAMMAEVPWAFFPLAMFVVGVALVPVVLWLDGRATGEHAKASQYVVRTLAFATWAMAVAWPFGPWIDPGAGRWLISLGVLLVPFIGELLLREKQA